MSKSAQKVFDRLVEILDTVSEDDLLWIFEELGLEARDSRGNSLLHLAASRGFGGLCEQLVTKGFSPRETNNAGQTPMSLALEGGHLDLALSLRRAGIAAFSSSARKYSSATNRSGKAEARGIFAPVAETRLNESDPDWKIPADLGGVEEAVDHDDFRTELLRVRRILDSWNLAPEEAATSLYIKLTDRILAVDAVRIKFFDASVPAIGKVEKMISGERAALSEIIDEEMCRFLGSIERCAFISERCLKFIEGSVFGPMGECKNSEVLAVTQLVREQKDALERVSEELDGGRLSGFLENFLDGAESLLARVSEIAEECNELLDGLCGYVDGDLFENDESGDEDLFRLDLADVDFEELFVSIEDFINREDSE